MPPTSQPSWENTYTAWGDVAEVAAGDEGKVDAPGVRASAILRAHDASESVYSADAKLGVVDSHALVEVSAADGRPMVRVGHSERFGASARFSKHRPFGLRRSGARPFDAKA